jgi:hypothetical protein
VRRAPPGGAVGPLEGARCMSVIFIFNEIRTQDKIYILVGGLFG